MPSSELAEEGPGGLEEEDSVTVVNHDLREDLGNGHDGNGHTEIYTEREGTVSSGRFNLLSTMVGGGSLSLPLAFQKSGNAFFGPVFMVLVAASAEFCIRLLIASSDIIVARNPPVQHSSAKGLASMEAVASAAFGPHAHLCSMGLVTALCFFGTVGYAVLLRDMLEPIADAIFVPPEGTPDGPTMAHNMTMLSVILLVTPLCTLQTMTALRRAGAASMFSVLVLGSCVVYRSLQCNLGSDHDSDRHTSWFNYLTYFPGSAKQLLDALPLYVSCFVCHYNVLPVHNELRNPTPRRVSWLVRSTTWFAASFYLIIGFAGSMYGNCTPDGTVHGNVLLDFDEHDPLLLVGRLCLALTLTMAFPMLVIPARDIVLHYWQRRHTVADSAEVDRTTLDSPNVREQLREPLLVEENGEDHCDQATNTASANEESVPVPLYCRAVAAIGIFWSGAAVASSVSSIDVVWDLLGSSLSILLSYLIPCGSYLVLDSQRRRLTGTQDNGDSSNWKRKLVSFVAWFLVILFLPLMFISTGNAVYNTFFSGAT